MREAREILLKQKDVVLRKVKLAASATLSGQTLKDLDMEVMTDWLTDFVVTRFSTRVLAETLDKREATVFFHIPATWWQMFKEAQFPAWLLRRFPVRRKPMGRKVMFESLAAYPELPLVYPKCGESVIISSVHMNNEEGINGG